MKTSTIAKRLNSFSNKIARMTRNLTDDQRQNVLNILNRELTFVPPALPMPQDFTTVNSSLVRGFGYIADSQKLTVSLTNDRCYLYHNVPASVVTEFANAPSAGKFFNQNIRNKYDWAEF